MAVVCGFMSVGIKHAVLVVSHFMADALFCQDQKVVFFLVYLLI